MMAVQQSAESNHDTEESAQMMFVQPYVEMESRQQDMKNATMEMLITEMAAINTAKSNLAGSALGMVDFVLTNIVETESKNWVKSVMMATLITQTLAITSVIRENRYMTSF